MLGVGPVRLGSRIAVHTAVGVDAGAGGSHAGVGVGDLRTARTKQLTLTANDTKQPNSNNFSSVVRFPVEAWRFKAIMVLQREGSVAINPRSILSLRHSKRCDGEQAANESAASSGTQEVSRRWSGQYYHYATHLVGLTRPTPRYLFCKEHGAVKRSTDPSQTAGTYLRNLLPDQGGVFRQLQIVFTLNDQFRDKQEAQRPSENTSEVLHGKSSLNRVGYLSSFLRQVRSTETIRKHIGGSARNLLPEQGGIFTVFSGSWTRGLWYRDNIYLVRWVVREKHPQVLSGTGPNRPPRPPPKKQCRLVSQQAKHQDDISYGRRCRRPPQMVGGGAGDLRRWLEEVPMKWWPEVAKVAEVAEATWVTSALCSGYFRQTSART
ncbi:hypothetical protein B0H13DRAFT_1913223 [Mycena leptocephala]|nr:hypothetical protein B0H13DRAFT_1913223 [Mycena leptocephala]